MPSVCEMRDNGDDRPGAVFAVTPHHRQQAHYRGVGLGMAAGERLPYEDSSPVGALGDVDTEFTVREPALDAFVNGDVELLATQRFGNFVDAAGEIQIKGSACGKDHARHVKVPSGTLGINHFGAS